jgi:hypothetical protein
MNTRQSLPRMSRGTQQRALAGLAALCAATISAGYALAADPSLLTPSNRIVTKEEQGLELQALKLLASPVGQQAQVQIGRYQQNFVGETDNEAVFQAALKTNAFCGALIAANSDSNHPKIHAQGVPAHRVGTRDIPDSACGIPNVDTIYRFIPVDGESHYLITGHVAAHRPIENNFTLASYGMTTIANINGRDLKVDPDGSFKITIDPEPANGRPNHLQTRHDAFQIWIRDTLGDWSKEKPNRLTIQRLDPNPPVETNFDGQVAMIGRYATYVIASMPAEVINGPANTFKQPKVLGGAAGSGGFLVTQAYSNGRFQLADDQALVLTLKLGYAGYAIVPVTNMWGTNDGVGRLTGALNNFQADRNADGTYTFVITKNDPGIANWVDTGGLNQGTVVLRWAAFPAGDLSKLPPPAVQSSVVKVSELNALLPNVRHVNSAQRQQERAAHRQALYRRLNDD